MPRFKWDTDSNPMWYDTKGMKWNNPPDELAADFRRIGRKFDWDMKAILEMFRSVYADEKFKTLKKD